MPFYALPDSGVAPVIHFIQEANGPLVINNYFLDDRQVLRAIRVRVEEGGKVYLILEPHPYEISRGMVTKEFAEAKATGAYVESAPPQFATGRVFDHAKYAVSLNMALIGTPNWDHSAFTHNREFIYTTSDPEIVHSLQKVAMADLKHEQLDTVGFPTSLTISPGAADEIAPVLSQAGEIDMETEELQPNNPLFGALESKGPSARVIVPAGLTHREEEAVNDLVQAGVQVRVLPKDPIYIHAKMIVGGTMGWVGSQNFSTTSLDENREVGIILSDPNDLAQMRSSFDQDWSAASPLGG